VDAEQLQACLGVAVDEPAMVAVWKALGTEPPRFPKGEDDAFLELPASGLVFVVVRNSVKSKRSRTARLGGVEFHRGFAGTLPSGLRFEHERGDVHRMLGAPTSESPDFWHRGDHELVVEHDGAGAIEKVYLYLPGFSDGDLELP
jgi:hypothetical protein